MNMSDLMMKFFQPSQYQAQPPATDDGTDDWAKLHRQMGAVNGANAADIAPRSPAGWPATKQPKLPAYSQTTGSGQSGTAY